MASEPKVDPETALAYLDDDAREAYAVLMGHVETCEAGMPTVLTPENSEAVGDLVAKAKSVSKTAKGSLDFVTAEWTQKVKEQRSLWGDIIARANAVVDRGVTLARTLLAKEEEARNAREAQARQEVRRQMEAQAAAEAAALAASTPEEAKAADVAMNAAWDATRREIQKLDEAQSGASVKLGSVTVYESRRLDFEITDLAAFAKAHPELVEVKRGPTVAALRAAIGTAETLPPSVPGFPGIVPVLTKSPGSR